MIEKKVDFEWHQWGRNGVIIMPRQLVFKKIDKE